MIDSNRGPDAPTRENINEKPISFETTTEIGEPQNIYDEIKIDI